MGSSSGLIIAFVVVVWAAYAIPLALHRYDEASKNASVETTGSLARVISRPRAAAAAAAAPAPEPAAPVVEAGPAPAPARSLDRPAARLAAKRRRRTLLTLLALTVVVGAVAGFGVIPLYTVAAPVALVIAWLVACRIQVRGERGIAKARTPRVKAPRTARTPRAEDTRTQTEEPAPKASRRRLSMSRLSMPKMPRLQPVAPTAADEEDTIVVSGQFEDIDPARKHQMEDVALEADALDDKIVIAVPSISTTGEALWDPLPVTLPTYVTKPRAGRTVRTIDFSQPHTWTSGHIEGEDVELPARRDEGGDERRAVGH